MSLPFKDYLVLNLFNRCLPSLKRVQGYEFDFSINYPEATPKTTVFLFTADLADVNHLIIINKISENQRENTFHSGLNLQCYFFVLIAHPVRLKTPFINRNIVLNIVLNTIDKKNYSNLSVLVQEYNMSSYAD